MLGIGQRPRGLVLRASRGGKSAIFSGNKPYGACCERRESGRHFLGLSDRLQLESVRRAPQHDRLVGPGSNDPTIVEGNSVGFKSLDNCPVLLMDHFSIEFPERIQHALFFFLRHIGSARREKQLVLFLNVLWVQSD